MSKHFLGYLGRALAEIVLPNTNNTNSSKYNYTNIEGNIEYKDDTDFVQQLEDKEKHSDFLWLLVIDLLIFIALTATSYSSSKKLAAKASVTTSIAEDFKPKFIKGLIYANGSK
jgi:hypothetical protein